ncbi:MAG: family 43 glycosylhydrolase [Sphingobacteriaceae bacterium]
MQIKDNNMQTYAKTILKSAVAASIMMLGLSLNCYAQSSSGFHPGKVWTDCANRPIESHCGGILFEKGVYYWYGMDFSGPTIYPGTYPGQTYSWQLNKGMTCYSSTNLLDWTYRSTSMGVEPNISDHPLHDATTWISRPKVLKSRTTGKYVMIGTLVSMNFKLVKCIAGVSDTPEGPFVYHTVLNPSGGGYDMSLYQDDDGKSYLITSHGYVKAHLLSDDLLSILKTTDLKGVEGEAPAIFKYEGTYYFITSRLTGWAPNRNTYSTSSSLLGPYTPKGFFAEGPGYQDTFGGQATYVLPIEGKKGEFIFMADRFNAINISTIPDLSKSTHIWLPITINATEKSIKVTWRDSWGLTTLTK